MFTNFCFRARAILLAGCGLSVGFLTLDYGGSRAFAGPLPITSSNKNRIAFASNRDGNFEIYTMTSDGRDVQRLTKSPGDDREPAWNRDHSKIAFISDRDGNPEIYVFNVVNGQVDGEAQRITNTLALDRVPSWSPDGTQLVFESYSIDERFTALYIVDVATHAVHRLTQRTDFEGFNPVWSPKADLIAFVSSPRDVGNFREGPPHTISTIKSNGEDLKRITTGERRADGNPSWHPNGQSLIFERSSVGLMTVDADGTNEKLITTTGSQFFQAAYSPNGSQIVCVCNFLEGEGVLSSGEIFVLSANNPSVAPNRLTSDLNGDRDPNW